MKTCTLMDKYIRLMISGHKTIEARIALPMFQQWSIGEKIKFFSRRNPEINVIVKVTAVNKYKCFQDLLTKENIDSLIPGVSSIEEGVNIYLNIPKYAERESQYGVLAFHVQKT